MKTKKCTVELPPPPPPPDPCKEQRIQQKIKAGIKICPPVPVEPPPPPPSCHALCIEKIKNFPVKVTNQPVVCTVEREETGQARCDKIRDIKAAHPDLPWPGCEQPPPPPPPPEPDLCELQTKRAKLEECKERMKREYYERVYFVNMDRIKKTFSSNLDALIEKFRTETNRQSEEEFINTRRLTTESPYKPPDTEPSHDIDRQITDLESLIKRLQDEIIDMTTEADNPLDEDNLRKWFTKAHYNLEINERNKTDSDKTGTSKQDKTNNNKDPNKIDTNTNQTNSQVFPIIISNINPLVTDPYNDDVISCIHSSSVSELAANFTEIRRNFSLLWDDVEGEVASKKGDDVKTSDTGITFIELTDEIIESISNEATGMPLCNSKENFN